MATITEVQDFFVAWLVEVTGREVQIANSGLSQPRIPYIVIQVMMRDSPDHDIVTVAQDGLSETVRGLGRLDMSIQAIGGGPADHPIRVLQKFYNSMSTNERILNLNESGIGISGSDTIRDISTESGRTTELRALLNISISTSSPDTFTITSATTVEGQIEADGDKTVDFSAPPPDVPCGV